MNAVMAGLWDWYQYIEHRNINSADLEWVWSYYYDIVDNANIILANIDNSSDAALLKTAEVQFIKANALHTGHSASISLFSYLPRDMISVVQIPTWVFRSIRTDTGGKGKINGC